MPVYLDHMTILTILNKYQYKLIIPYIIIVMTACIKTQLKSFFHSDYLITNVFGYEPVWVRVD